MAVRDSGSSDINDINLQVYLIKRLLIAGCDVQARNGDGKSVAEVAKQNPNPQILQVLDPVIQSSPRSSPSISHRNSIDSTLRIDEFNSIVAEEYLDASQEDSFTVLSPSSSIATLLTKTNLQEYIPLFEKQVGAVWEGQE